MSAQGLGELPAMAGQVHERAVAFAVLAIGGRFDHVRAVRTAPARKAAVTSSTRTRVRFLVSHLLHGIVARTLGHDHRTVCADAHLGAVALADPGALDEAERSAQPRHRRPHVGVGKDGHHGNGRSRPVHLHPPRLPDRGHEIPVDLEADAPRARTGSRRDAGRMTRRHHARPSRHSSPPRLPHGDDERFTGYGSWGCPSPAATTSACATWSPPRSGRLTGALAPRPRELDHPHDRSRRLTCPRYFGSVAAAVHAPRSTCPGRTNTRSTSPSATC